MTGQDSWDLWVAIEEIKAKAETKDEQVNKLTKSLRRLRADIKRAKAQERAICDTAEQKVRKDILAFAQEQGQHFQEGIDKLVAQNGGHNMRFEMLGRFEDEVRDLLGLGSREKAPWEEG